MTTFAQRMPLASALEQAVAGELLARGHTVEPFGQALLAPSVRDGLRETDSVLRWLPDLAVMTPGRRGLILVDAKGCQTSSTPNHAIELRSLYATTLTGLPTFYVCQDRKLLSPLDVSDSSEPDGFCCRRCWDLFVLDPMQLPKRCPEHERRQRRGSGTPYVLIKRARCRPLASVFGEVV